MARLDMLATTPRQIVASFGAVIFTGSLLLWLPFTLHPGAAPVAYIDALFTATSAVCVTGLAVRDPGTTFNFGGQLVMLVLIQLGGLGILTLTNLFFQSQARQISPLGRQQVEASIGNMRDIHPRELLRKMVRYTMMIELAGTLLLFFRFWQEYPAGRACWLAVFHAVSAFCNAGYGLFSDNLMAYRDDFLVNLVVMGLIVSGGLGFIVYADLSTFRHRRLAGLRPKLSLHTRMVLQITAFLILAGALIIGLLELNGHALGGDHWAAWHTGLFLAVTARTAGFNTVDTSLLSNTTLLVLVSLMVIGGSPGGTAGGLKTTTFGTIWALGWSRLRHRRRTEFGGKTLADETVMKAIMSAGGYLVTLVIGTLLIQLIETYVMTPQQMREQALGLFFETASALGTVGLSTGLTPQLAAASKIVLILLMLMGRVGPLLFAATLMTHRPQPQYTLPEDTVNIG